jgi:hypothetical protein
MFAKKSSAKYDMLYMLGKSLTMPFIMCKNIYKFIKHLGPDQEKLLKYEAKKGSILSRKKI